MFNDENYPDADPRSKISVDARDLATTGNSF